MGRKQIPKLQVPGSSPGWSTSCQFKVKVIFSKIQFVGYYTYWYVNISKYQDVSLIDKTDGWSLR